MQEFQKDSIMFFGSILAAIGIFFDLVGSAMVDNNNNSTVNVTLGVAWWFFVAYILTLILIVLSASGNATFSHLQLVFLTLSLAYLPSDINISITINKALVQVWSTVQKSSELQNLYNGMALRSAGLIILAIVWFVQIIVLTVKPGKVAPSSPKKETV